MGRRGSSWSWIQTTDLPIGARLKSTAQGWPMARYIESGGAWFVRSHTIEYLRQALLGDRIAVCTWVGSMEERTSLRNTVFLRTAARRQILVRAQTLWTFVDTGRGRSMPVSQDVRQAFEVVASEEEALAAAGL